MAHDDDYIDNVDDNDNNEDDDNTRDVQICPPNHFCSQCLFIILCPTMFLNDIFRGYLK